MAATLNAKKIFGDVVSKGVGNLMIDYTKDPAKLTTSTENSINIALAPSFGKLREDVKKLDDALVGIVAISTKEIEKLAPIDRTFEKMRSILLQNPAIEAWVDETGNTGDYHATDALIKSSTNDFKFDGSPDSAIVEEALTFMSKLIKDPDVVDSLKFDKKAMANIVAQSGATVRNFETFFSASEYEEKNVLEVGVLRYPDLDNPFVKLYRVKFSAVRDCKRIIWHETNKNYLKGEVDIQKFKPRDSTWANVTKDLRQKAVASVIAMLDDL
ncbi:hypothetical protein TWF696_001754 [Orbilia brochopaga]|uniref:Uncharacterized protein n=1 Tax=Orbilia brochopaga TaxID=3140254 RepID=A0AAV9U828_9PEZI